MRKIIFGKIPEKQMPKSVIATSLETHKPIKIIHILKERNTILNFNTRNFRPFWQFWRATFHCTIFFANLDNLYQRPKNTQLSFTLQFCPFPNIVTLQKSHVANKFCTSAYCCPKIIIFQFARRHSKRNKHRRNLQFSKEKHYSPIQPSCWAFVNPPNTIVIQITGIQKKIKNQVTETNNYW